MNQATIIMFPFRNPPRLMAPPVIYCAQDGECSGANSEYLAVLCPHSCGTCTLTCEDTDVSCSAWAKNGDCTTNAGFMLKACPTSCGLCTPACKDVHEDCAGWTSAGACAENPDVSNMHMFRAAAPSHSRAEAPVTTHRVQLACGSLCSSTARSRAACAVTSARIRTTIAPAGRPRASATRTPASH